MEMVLTCGMELRRQLDQMLYHDGSMSSQTAVHPQNTRLNSDTEDMKGFGLYQQDSLIHNKIDKGNLRETGVRKEFE